MCLIICRPQKNIDSYTLDKERILNAIESNNDGVGILYKKNNRVQVIKSLETDPETIYAMLEEHLKEADRLGVDFLAHLRFKTHGRVSEENLHPFRINTTRRGGPVFMMHNGVIRSNDRWEKDAETKGLSDTYHFAKYVLGPMIKNNPRLIRNHQFRNLLSRDLGRTNRLALMDKSGDVFLIAADGGHSEGGLWFSNNNYFDSFGRYAGNNAFGTSYGASVPSKKSVPTVATTTAKKEEGDVGKSPASSTTQNTTKTGAFATSVKPTGGSTTNKGSSNTGKSVAQGTTSASARSASTQTKPKVLDSSVSYSDSAFYEAMDEIDSAAENLKTKLLDKPHEAVQLYTDMTNEMQTYLQDFFPDIVEDLEEYNLSVVAPKAHMTN